MQVRLLNMVPSLLWNVCLLLGQISVAKEKVTKEEYLPVAHCLKSHLQAISWRRRHIRALRDSSNFTRLENSVLHFCNCKHSKEVAVLALYRL